MSSMWVNFYLRSNKLCSAIPTQVQALSSRVVRGWEVVTGNSIGTTCGAYDSWPNLPTVLPSSTTIQITGFDQKSFTGTIPTQWGLLTIVSEMNIGSNKLTGSVPTQLGRMVAMHSFFDLSSNSLSSAIPTGE